MYNLLIVDDEIISQLGVQNLLNWETYNFNLVATANNGQEAFDLLTTTPIDLVITDVKMPIMSGIELIRTAKEAGYSTKFILLSSHEDYTYVREGLNLGALDYLLKLELKPDTIIPLLEKAKGLIDLDTNTQDRRSTFEPQTLSTARGGLIKSLMYGRFTNHKEIQSQCMKLDIHLPYSDFRVVVFNFDSLITNDQPNNFLVIISFVNDILDDFEYGYACETTLGEISVLLNFSSDNIHSQLEDILERLSFFMEKFFNKKTDIYVSDLVHSIDAIPLAYLQVCQIKGYKSNSNSEIIYYKDIMVLQHEKNANELDQQLIHIEKAAHKSLDDYISTLNTSIEFFSNLKYINHPKTVFIIINIIRISEQYLETLLKKDVCILDKRYNTNQLSSLITRKKDIVLVLNKIKNGMILYGKDLDNNHIVRNVKQYLQEHYNEGISIKDVANTHNVSSSYLSTLFKKETGTTIKEYLLQLQLDHAKELLKTTTDLVLDIANQVGYENEHQFSKIFKQKTGITPTMYRNQV